MIWMRKCTLHRPIHHNFRPIFGYLVSQSWAELSM